MKRTMILDANTWYKFSDGYGFIVGENSYNQYLINWIVDGYYVEADGKFITIYEKPIKAKTNEIIMELLEHLQIAEENKKLMDIERKRMSELKSINYSIH